MRPPASLPALPFAVGADRAGAVRRRRIAIPILFLAAIVTGGTWPFMVDAFLDGRDGLGWALALLSLAGIATFVICLPQSRRPPEDDWLFALEPAGLRFPPGRRAGTVAPGHPGILVPWPLITSLTPRRSNGEPAIHIGLRPEIEGVLTAQGLPPERARLIARRAFRLRLGGGALPPEQCLQLIATARDAHTG